MKNKRISLCLGLTIFSWALLVGITRRTPQTLYGDPAYQFRALQQFLAGESTSFNRLTTPDPKDLTKDVTEWFSWWPPGPQLSVYLFLVNGISLGKAVRAVVAGFLFVGCIGWVLWFGLFDLPPEVQIGWALLMPWMRYSSNGLFAFSAEVFAFGLAPWILFRTHQLVQACETVRRRRAIVVMAAAVLGLGLGSCYVLKYSIVFASLAALMYLGSKIFSVNHETRNLTAASFVAALLGFLLPVVGLNVLNYHISHDMNPLVSTAGFNGKWLSIPWVVALPALALADSYSFLDYVFLHPVHGFYPHESLVCLLGLPGGLLLLWLLYRQRGQAGPARLGIMTLATNMTAMFLAWNTTRVGNYDGRYFAVFGMAVLPVALDEAIALWRSRAGLVMKTTLAAAGMFCVVVPLLYGIASVVVKNGRLPSDYRYGPSHLYNGFLADKDLRGVRRQLLEDYHPDSDIWYLPDPVTTLDIPGRAIICFADFIEIAELQSTRYASPVPKRVRVLLPPRFELNGKGPAIRGSFAQAGLWTRREIPGSNYVLWEATLKPR